MFSWKKAVFDERFVMHRLYSTRFAVVVSAVIMSLWFYYDMAVNEVYHWDIFIFLVVMAVAKISALLYYRFRH